LALAFSLKRNSVVLDERKDRVKKMGRTGKEPEKESMYSLSSFRHHLF
jgi:hypothetical protein